MREPITPLVVGMEDVSGYPVILSATGFTHIVRIPGGSGETSQPFLAIHLVNGERLNVPERYFSKLQELLSVHSFDEP